MIDIQKKILISNAERKRAITLLAEELNKKSLVIFLGAGCSMSAGLPSWNELVDKLLQKHSIPTKETDLLRLATRIERRAGSSNFRKDISEKLRTRPDIESTLHDTLVSLDVNLFITTNYDHFLEDSFTKQSYSPQVIWNDQDLPSIDPTEKVIVKLHGDIDSPSSLIITSIDYTKFKSEHQAFIEWLGSIVSQKTVLFIGTGFDDPRLKEVDDHVINLFGDSRRKPFIFLKAPEQDTSTSDEDFEIEMEDFEALCDDFKGRGFFVIPISEYNEINYILREINTQALSKRIQEDPSDLKSKFMLQSDYSGKLEQSLRNLLDDKILELSEWVRGNGQLPTLSVMIERAQKLIHELENPPLPLKPESQMEGWLTVVDALLNAEKRDKILQSRQYFDKANAVFQGIKNKGKWAERLMRVRAKLLLFEGKIDEAIESLSKSKDNKTISLWLALLLDSNRFTEAYDFVSTHKVHPYWVCEALFALIYTGRVQQAEDLFKETIEEYEAVKNDGNLEESPFKGIFFYEKICFVMAESLYRRALRLTGEKGLGRFYPGKLTKNGEKLCKRSLKFIDMLFKQASRQNLIENYFATLAEHIEMSAAYLLSNFERSDRAAKDLASIKPIKKEVASYIVVRKDIFEKKFLEIVLKRLYEDHPDQYWSFLKIAFLEASFNKKKSWNALIKAGELASTMDEKAEVSMIAFEVAHNIDRLDEALAMINEILPPDNLRRRFLEANYLYISGERKASEQKFIEIEGEKPPPEISAEIKFMRAKNAIKEEKWEEARKFLEESSDIFIVPFILKELLYVLTKLQDDVEALKISEKIEALGDADYNVILIKAQTARNLGQFKKSEKAWRYLNKKFPQSPQYSYGLAEILILQDAKSNKDEALKTIQKFIKNDKNFDLNCLTLACDIHIANNDFKKAFDLLETHFNKIEDTSHLLLRHIDLGYRTDNEKEVGKSLRRLKILKQDGKVTEKEFFELTTNEALSFFRKRHESLEKVKDLYKSGKIPRLLLCDHFNMPLYLDWAVRTQELIMPSEQKKWIDYTIYSTNGLRVDFAKKTKNQLVPISAPQKAEEIVIAYHALITVHRLNLFEKLAKRYSKIYYPLILENVWIADQKRFSFHQLSREKAYRKLNERLQTGQIKDSLAPDLSSEKEQSNDNPTKRNLRLAALEGIPLIDSYMKKEEVSDSLKIVIIRLVQVLDWLFQKGRLGEEKWKELKNIAKGEEPVYKEFEKTLETTYRFLIAETTLELMEQYGLIQILTDMGVQVFVERYTANYIRNAVRELDFGIKVGEWHKDLSESIKRLKVFKGVTPKIEQKDKNLLNSLYAIAEISSINYAAEKGFPLLTDDRWTQMMPIRQSTNNQFGTDALLNDLYKKGIIDLEGYANSFLQLCKWRYRFLLPDIEILVFFAQQYKKNPPGEPLETIAAYGRNCMEDPGLFLGLEPTDPPLPLGVKFHIEWISKWIRSLIKIWQDESFNETQQKEYTNWIYKYALPEPPKDIKEEIRRNLATNNEKAILRELFLGAVTTKKPIKLHNLFNLTFDIFSFNEEKRIQELKYFFSFLSEDFGEQSKKEINIITIKVSEAFYGSNQITFDPSLLDILSQIGIKFEEAKQTKVSNEERDSIMRELALNISKREQFRRDISEFTPKGPIILTSPSKGKDKEALVPHDIIQAPSIDAREGIVKDILKNDYVSKFTKNIIQDNVESIRSGDLFIWSPASGKVKDALLKDFFYTHYLFKQTLNIPFKGNELLNTGWRGTLNPDLDTVLCQLPLLLNGDLDEAAVLQRVKNKANELPGLKEFLDWYLKEIFFIPVGPPINPWNILNLATPQCEDSEEILAIVKEWVKNNEDPLAYLVALELVLNARSRAKESEIDEFTKDEFYEFSDQLFKVLLIEEEEQDESESSNLYERHSNKIHAVWQMRVELARYYLQYVDINMSRELEDEKRVAIAWWMAREVCNSIVQACRHRKPRDQISYINEKTETVIRMQANIINIRHVFSDQPKLFSVGRFYTLNGIAPLTSATVSLLIPFRGNDPKYTNTFNGLKQPTTALSARFTDIIIQKLTSRMLIGEGQISRDNESNLNLLWNVSICVSAPVFLREYYGDAFDFLGKEKVNVIKDAEYTAQPEFLNNELVKLPQMIKDKQISPVVFILAALKVFVFTHGKMPEQASVFKKNNWIAQELGRSDDHLAGFCLINLISILKRLQLSGDMQWAKIFRQLFYQIDYSKLSDNIIDFIVPELIHVALLKYDSSIMHPILEKKNTNKRVRLNLTRVKSWLEGAFSFVPASNRENFRIILNDLADIPVPAE